MFAYPLAYDLLTSTAEESSEIRQLVDSIVGE